MVVLNGCSSAKCNVRSGVPQGSVLGPILFLLYINGLEKVPMSADTKFVLYADDTLVYKPICSLHDHHLFQLDLNAISNWQKFLKFRGYEIAPETIFGQYDASRRPDDRVSHEYHSAHCVVLRWCRFLIQSTYRPKATPFAGKDCEINRSVVRTKSCWKTRGTVLSHCAQSSRKFQRGNYVLWGRPPSNGANWQRQAKLRAR